MKLNGFSIDSQESPKYDKTVKKKTKRSTEPDPLDIEGFFDGEDNLETFAMQSFGRIDNAAVKDNYRLKEKMSSTMANWERNNQERSLEQKPRPATQARNRNPTQWEVRSKSKDEYEPKPKNFPSPKQGNNKRVQK